MLVQCGQWSQVQEVCQTARQAFEAGLNVTLAIDAMTDARPNAHDYSIEQVFPRLGETGSTQAIIDLLERIHAHELA
jgi:nicotinamidase-related amidase